MLKEVTRCIPSVSKDDSERENLISQTARNVSNARNYPKGMGVEATGPRLRCIAIPVTNSPPD
jgi:hypothetical protein